MTVAPFKLEVGPANLCVSVRTSNQGHVESIEACASMLDGGAYHTVRASLALFAFGEARRLHQDVFALCELHGFPQLAEDEYVSDRFEQFEPLLCERVLVLKSIMVGPARGAANLDLALVRRCVDMLGADVLMVPWPPPGANPERWAALLSSVALTTATDDPAWLYQLTRERWPVELVQREVLFELVGDPVKRNGTHG